MYEIGNQLSKFSFDAKSGALCRLVYADLDIHFTSQQPADARVGGGWLSEKFPRRLVKAEPDTTRAGYPALGFTYSFGDDFTLTEIYTLFPEEMRLERFVELTRSASADERVKLEGFRLGLDGFCLGSPADCVIDCPGPFSIWDWGKLDMFLPRTPLSHLAGKAIQQGSAPDWGPGILAISNARRGICLAAWMDTGGQVNVLPTLRGDGQKISFGFENLRMQWVASGETIRSDVQHIAIAKTLAQSLALFRQCTAHSLPPVKDRPAWVDEMVILEAMPEYYPGRLNGLAERLPFYRDLGINTLYLMPHWLGGYKNMDPYLVDPRLGTREDLQALTHTAHNLGMHVLFDMVVHGFDPQSALVRERPEMFFHNEDGSLAAHPTWKTISTDWASPSYREYMTDLVRHQVEVYEIDGYRLDAAAFKGANWDPNLPYPAERSGCAALELLGEMRRAGRERKSDFIILNEVFGPAFYAACDLTHDNMTMGPEMFLEAFQQGQAGGFERADIDAELYKEHMANLYDLLPQDARRVFFARNHDTSWFYHFGGYTPRHRALDAVHAFFGIPEFFGGDPNNGPNPEDVPDLLNDMQTIWAARKRRPEWTRGKIMLHEVSSDNRLVFAGVRRLGENAVLALVSFSSQVEQVRVTWEGGVFTGQMEDVLTGHTQQAHLAGSTISVEMQPFQILIG